MPAAANRRLLLIGWDAADWRVIDPLLDAGKMPALEGLINRGVRGNLATLDPPMSPMLWTSIATGKTADKHGILNFTQPRPDGTGIQPVLGSSRKAKAVWNILMQAGLRTHVVGWWPSHPAEPLRGVAVSNFFHRIAGPIDQPWPLPQGAVQPPELAEALGALRVHPEELSGQHLLPFVPKAAEIDQEKDRRLGAVARIIAEAASIHAAATGIMVEIPWDFMAVYYDAVDHFCHGFMRYHPPLRPGVDERSFELYSGVVEAGYRLHDMMLARLLELAGPETTVLLCSDHGFHPDHLRPTRIPNEPAGPAYEHRELGVLVMAGPGLREDELVFGSSLLDIAPTILALFGLPVGQDMDGKVLTQAFRDPPAVATIPSWEAVAGDCGMRPEASQALDPWVAGEAMRQLADLGYVDGPGESAARSLEISLRESQYYLARVHLNKGLYQEALPILTRLFADDPDELRFGIYQANALLGAGDADGAAAVHQRLVAGWHRLWQKRQNKKAEEGGAAGEPGAAPPPGATEPPAPPPALDYLRGRILFAQRQPEPAAAAFQAALDRDPQRPETLVGLGDALVRLGRLAAAQRAYARALERDPDSAAAHQGLARLHLRARRPEEAATAALESVGLLHHNPLAHFLLGQALVRLGRHAEAAAAFRVAVRQAPRLIGAHRRLVDLYTRHLNAPLEAARHLTLIDEAIRARRRERRQAQARVRRPERPAYPAPAPLPPLAAGREVITIVSGLPRSGTSMMMQMLAAGGLAPLTDGQRPADDHNARGYFEFAPAARLARDASWLPQAQGRAVKIVAQLLPFLPEGPAYRVIFMERGSEEVLASQARLLADQGRKGARLAPAELAAAFGQQVAQVQATLTGRGIPWLPVSFQDTLAQPAATAAAVNAFLGRSLDEAAMAAAVAPELSRARTPGAAVP
ncbi:MAG: alkaline phosphatase family protein [Thermodesulfobacteriota bacterium]